MTPPTPIWKLAGVPVVRLESNSLPFLYSTPTYCTLRLSPDLAAGPLPFTRSLTWSVLGAGPDGTWTLGLWASTPVGLAGAGAGAGVA